jgi:hypothetical protein
MRIHSALGPGFSKAIGFEIEGLRFENAFVLDLLVDSRVAAKRFEAWDQADGEPTGRGSPPSSAPPRAPREMMPASCF